jgi:hypothetical protein
MLAIDGDVAMNDQSITSLVFTAWLLLQAVLGAPGWVSAQSIDRTSAIIQPAPLSVPGIDLDVAYISREPRYDWTSAKQWPDPGELVTFTAHIINKGTTAVGPSTFEWRLDGQVIHSGLTGSIFPQGETTQTLVWPWQTGRHVVSFRADPQNLIPEFAETNNEIKDTTDAMSIGFWVEQSVYAEFNLKQNGSGTYSWEDWAQTIVQKMNWMFEQSVFPLAPQGGLTRVRLDKVTVVPDGTLFNLNWQHAPLEYTTDVQWGFSVEEYLSCSDQCYVAPWWVIHELMHYLYARIDIYALDVQAGDVQVRDDSGNLIAGTPLLPYIAWDVVYYASRSYDLMHNVNEQTIFSDYTIYSLNMDWPMGQRTHRSDWEHYFLVLPAETRIRVLDNNAQPIPGVQVSLYQAVWGDGSSGPYSQYFDNLPDIVGTTSSQGLFSLGSHPFGNLDQYGTPAGVALIKLQHPISGQSRYVWLELTGLNMAYWRGETGLYMRDLYFPDGPQRLRLSQNELSFSVVQGVNPVPQNIEVILSGEGVAQWSVSRPDSSWLRTIPSPDLTPQAYPSGPLTFIPNSANLSIGTYMTHVIVDAGQGVLDSPQTIRVILQIIEPSKVYLPLVKG